MSSHRDTGMSTEEFLRSEVFRSGKSAGNAASFKHGRGVGGTLLSSSGEMSAEDFLCREVFSSNAKHCTGPGAQTVKADSNDFHHLAANRPLRLTLELDAKGKLQRKIETSAKGKSEYCYAFDITGHLLSVRHDGKVVEQYRYNRLGQRIKAINFKGAAEYAYNNAGQLVAAGTTRYEYDARGRLGKKIIGTRGITFEYESGALPTRVLLPDGDRIEYAYAGIMPMVKYLNSSIVEEYVWNERHQLLEWRHKLGETKYKFEYTDKQRQPVALLTDRQHYTLGCDQVGSIKILLDSRGQLIKSMEYDSFGNTLQDSNPRFFLPLGFAGGLTDRHTGLLRFGWRDYDPETGRFTCPDPLGDTGGDHDLYDYCVDDPVSYCDPEGLHETPLWLAYTGGKKIASGLAKGGLYTAGWLADKLAGIFSGKESTKAMEGVKKAMDELDCLDDRKQEVFENAVKVVKRKL